MYCGDDECDALMDWSHVMYKDSRTSQKTVCLNYKDHSMNAV
jgi:hypothetical protein